MCRIVIVILKISNIITFPSVLHFTALSFNILLSIDFAIHRVRNTEGMLYKCTHRVENAIIKETPWSESAS
jgi:hypothetical protein